MPGAFKLEHLQPIKPLLFQYLFTFSIFILGRPILITPEGQLWEKGILPTSKQNETGGFQCLGHSNWVICSRLSHFCSKYFLTFSTFILGDHFLLPQKANYQKWEFFKLQNRMRQGVFSAWGIQTGPFAALCTSHILKLYHLFHLHTGRPIPITPEDKLWEKGTSWMS